VSESAGHGLQVFDLHQLRNVASPPVTFAESAHYDRFSRAHNVVVDEASGYAYAVGSVSGLETCGSGLHMIALGNPLNPAFAGCFADDGYTHDAQCVIYAGPDTEHQGSELCFAANEDTLTVVDVTNKSDPVQLAREGYPGSGYAHQGWLTDDHRWFLLDDELDEQFFGHNTRTYVWDLADVDAPLWVGYHEAAIAAADHNQYVVGDFTFQANYRGGLRILRLDDLATASMTEVGYFDIYPQSDSSTLNGAWSVYPFFASGNLIVSGIEQGLFVLRPELCAIPDPPTGLSAMAAGDHRIELAWDPAAEPGTTYGVERALGGCSAGGFETLAAGLTAPSYADDTASGQVTYGYRVSTLEASGRCLSAAGGCAEASTTGTCTAPPLFAGVGSVVNPAGVFCALDLAWPAASPSCGAGASYNVYRGPAPSFQPAPENRVAAGLGVTAYRDFGAAAGVDLAYVVRAVDSGSGAEDGNVAAAVGRATGPLADGPWATGAEIGDPELIVGTGTLAALGDGGGPRHVGWEVTPADAHSGARSLFSTYFNDQCSTLSTPAIALTAGEAPSLSFWTRYEIEDGWDGGVVEISTDDGATWSTLLPVGGYPGSFIPSADACGYLSGDPSFTGTQASWTPVTFDLAPWAGQSIRLRWVFSTDGGLTLEGWYVDDVVVTHAQVAGTCQPALFADGFESGGLGAWSAAAP
jgi:choice-of-anchor B domain-containing protein